jgi:hypothetical protein
MAKVSSSKSAKEAAPRAVSSVRNLDKSALGAVVPLNFKVPAEFRREFKIYAVQHGMKMNELLYEAFRVLKETLVS